MDISHIPGSQNKMEENLWTFLIHLPPHICILFPLLPSPRLSNVFVTTDRSLLTRNQSKVLTAWALCDSKDIDNYVMVPIQHDSIIQSSFAD